MPRTLTIVVLALAALVLLDQAIAQDSQAATATRNKLKQKLTINAKEVGFKNFFEDVNNELDKQIRFKIDNSNGLSNNSKISYSGKEVTVEKLLNDMADQYDFGYYVVSNAANNKEDGQVVIRRIMGKGKERGYEAGKEPKKGK
jgi:hypothetical protein